MGSLSGLALGCRPRAMAGTICASRSCSGPEDSTSRLHRLKECLDALQEERRKIDAFRRELPLCMHLLHDAIESHQEELALCTSSARDCSPLQVSAPLIESHSGRASTGDRVAVDESGSPKKASELPFTRNTRNDIVHLSIVKTDRIAMPVSVCPGSQGESRSHSLEGCQTDLAERSNREDNNDQAFSASSKPLFHSKTKSGGAFTPFSRDNQVLQPTARMGSLNPADLVGCHADKDKPQSGASHTLPESGKEKPQVIIQQRCEDLAVKGIVVVANGQTGGQSARKTRRCWSPELHRRFVNALEQLGGSQVATPKQIRELMKVEGLTNDEVKSHLQKYRLHTRRPNPAQNTPAQTPRVVVLGGIWIPPEYTAHAAAQQAPGLYSTSQQPPLCQAASSQEFCSEIGSVDQMHLPSPAFNCQKLAPSHSSQSSLHSSSQPAGHSSLVFHKLADTSREESVCDDEGSENSSHKGGQWRYQSHEMSEPEDDGSQGYSISGFQSNCMSNEEGNGGGDTSLDL